MPDEADFFVSYTGADERWAQWMAWHLEQAGYSTRLMAWDFRPGADFVREMNQALKECQRTLIVLSPSYLKSAYCLPEWTNTFGDDPTGEQCKLLPVRIADCSPGGLLKTRIYIDLIGLDEPAAREKLLAGVRSERAKPAKAPAFPGGGKTPTTSTRGAPAFPGALPAIWTVPFPPNPHFTGRDDLLDELHQRTTGRPAGIAQPQAVHGLGGSGKTQLAVEYAWKYRADYEAVLWVVADSPENAAANLAALARPGALNLPEAAEKEQAVQMEAVVNWLQQDGRWLLVFDSVDSGEAAEAVRQWLKPTWRGQVIITTQRTDWPVTISTLSVDPLETEEAADFLCDRTRAHRFAPGPRADALTVARELGGLPIALEQAAAYIIRHRITFADYLVRLKKFRKQLLQEKVMGATRYPKSVAETWLVSEHELSLTARAILRLAAFLAPDDIPRALFGSESKVTVEAVRALASERKEKQPGRGKLPDIEAALVELADHSLITLTPQAFSCHRLVQAVQSDRLTDKLRRHWIGLALRLVNDHAEGNPSDVRTWPVWEIMRAHAEIIVSRADNLGIIEPTERLMNELGSLLRNKALHREAEPLLRRALAIREQASGSEHPNVAHILGKLARVLQATNRLTEAEPLYRRALAIDEKAYGLDHPEAATGLNNLAQLLQVTNRLAEAEPLYRRALAINEKGFGADHPRVATNLTNLAALLKITNRLVEAEPLMRRALSIDEKAYGPDHPEVATDLNNLAVLLQDTNRLAEAEPLMRRALAIDEKAYGPDHPEVATDLNNLAMFLQDTNRLAEAEPLMRRHVIIFRKFKESTGHEHRDMQTGIWNYLELLKAMGLPKKEILQRVKEAAGE